MDFLFIMCFMIGKGELNGKVYLCSRTKKAICIFCKLLFYDDSMALGSNIILYNVDKTGAYGNHCGFVAGVYLQFAKDVSFVCSDGMSG